MVTGIVSKLALASVAAVGLYVPTMGLPLPLNTCLPTVGVANAAPSPTCGSDLRECLRQSADMRQTTFGGRYVTAEDVARCMEIFNACTHGTLQGTPNPPGPTSSSGGGARTAMPQRFRITQDAFTIDCTVEGGSAVSCTTVWETPPDWVDSWTAKFVGTLAGMTATGTATSHIKGHSPTDSSCTHVEDYSGPATYIFSPSGSVTMRVGPNQRQTTATCNGRQTSNSGVTDGVGEVTGTWVAVR